MRPLSAAEMLTAWEHGLADTALGRSLTLLVAACPDSSREELAKLSIGERDRGLLTLREWTFGSELVSVTNCLACGERLEWTINVADLRLAEQPSLTGDASLEVDGYSISFRLPNTLDLAAAAECADIAAARLTILERSVLAARLGEQMVAVDSLPSGVVAAIVQRMAEVDAQADMQLELSCPDCGHRWQALFDIASFFWSEINSWAQRLLVDVHTLARAYGWSETEILNLSTGRRQLYLGLVTG